MYAIAAPAIERVNAEARSAGTPPPTAIPHGTDGIPPRPGALRFPAKVYAAEEGRLFVADTGHHRVLEISLNADQASGRVTRAIGNGEPGWEDGALGEARFLSPHGLALAGETLYVADTAKAMFFGLPGGVLSVRAMSDPRR